MSPPGAAVGGPAGYDAGADIGTDGAVDGTLGVEIGGGGGTGALGGGSGGGVAPPAPGACHMLSSLISADLPVGRALYPRLRRWLGQVHRQTQRYRERVRIAITGTSGFIGSALVTALSGHGHDVVPIVRRPAAAGEISWDPAGGRLDAADLQGVDAVVHLAGAGIGDHRWTDDYRRTLVESRTRSTNLLSEAIAAAKDGPQVLLSGSAVGFYGPSGDEILDERSPAGADFLAQLCRDWEASTATAAAAGVRVVHLRTGIVLGRGGGVLTKLLPLFKLGLGGRFGSGRQWMSWITLDDEIGAIEHLLTSSASGAHNLTAPTPVTNAELTSTLAGVLRRPALLPVPAFAPRLLLGADRADALLLTGQRVVPRALQADGFVHRHPDLRPALEHVLGR